MTRGSMRGPWGRAAAAAGLAAAVLGAGGCARTPVPPTDDANYTVARAGYVRLMMENAMSGGPVTLATLYGVIADYGGGYVTSATLSGPPGTLAEKLTIDTVLGPGGVSSMQGERYLGPAPARCFRFSVGYFGRTAQNEPISCPAGLTAAGAAALDHRQAAVRVVANGYGGPAAGPTAALPGDLAAAERLARTSGLPAAAFAARPALAALAVPQPHGGCAYVRFARSTAAGADPSRLDVSGWPAPTTAACTGAAALATAGYVSADPRAGG